MSVLVLLLRNADTVKWCGLRVWCVSPVLLCSSLKVDVFLTTPLDWS